MELKDLKPAEGSRKPRKRVGRGPASGTGKTSGRGMNGQKSRAGGGKGAGFEGGQTPLARRLPKLPGFKNINHVEYLPVNVKRLEETFEAGDVVNGESLKAKGIIKHADESLYPTCQAPRRLDLFDLDQVLHLEDHAADGLVVHLLHGAVDLAEAKRAQGLALVVLVADGAFHLGDAQGLLCVSH